MTHALEAVKQFLEDRPFVELAGAPLAAQTLALLGERSPARRSKRLVAISDLYRLHVVYGELGILREGGSEKVDRFAQLLALPLEDVAAAVETGDTQSLLDLLLFCLELGPHRLEPRHTLMRRFLLQVFSLKKHGVAMKYSLYTGDVLYSASGKTHDELARDLARLGMTGPPLAGGSIVRSEPLTFVFDLGSTAYKATNNPEAVRGPLLHWIRNTGGREEQVRLQYDDRQVTKQPHDAALRRSHRFG